MTRFEGFDGFVTSAAAPIASGWSDQYAGGEIRSWVTAMPLFFHAGHGTEDADWHYREFLFRFGATYDFDVGNLTIAPAVKVDFVDGEEVFVFGINLGRGSDVGC